MANEAPQSIIIKKVKKAGHGGHHGGAWKIAYADFVTAMMAFFLLLWLLSAVSQESLEGISNYFAPISVSESTSGSGGVLGGTVISEIEGAGTATSGDSVTMELPPTSAGSGGQSSNDSSITEAAAKKAREQIEQQQFDGAEQALREAIDSDEELKDLKQILQIENTPEGMLIQLVDKDGLALFKSGGYVMEPHAVELMALVSRELNQLPHHLSISGHTDSVPFTTSTGYSNWELSADRANAARRELLKNGLPYERVDRVVGKAATEPLLPDTPTHPSNRRLSIVLLKGTGEPPAPEEEVLPGLNVIKQKQLLQQLDSSKSGNTSLEINVQ